MTARLCYGSGYDKTQELAEQSAVVSIIQAKRPFDKLAVGGDFEAVGKIGMVHYSVRKVRDICGKPKPTAEKKSLEHAAESVGPGDGGSCGSKARPPASFVPGL
jgi:hypothetical protein